jgi:hypothetical protein
VTSFTLGFRLFFNLLQINIRALGVIGKLTAFAAYGVQPVQTQRDMFHFDHEDFVQQFKGKVGLGKKGKSWPR